jgi:hypothetical protein
VSKLKIPPIPEDFMQITPKRYGHIWSTGTRENYNWLESNQLTIEDFFASVTPPRGGFRIAGFPGIRFDRSHENVDHTALGPIQFLWPKPEFTGMGDYMVMVTPNQVESDIKFFLKDAFRWNQPLRDPEYRDIATNEHFWNHVLTAKPLLYYSQHCYDFVLVCSDKKFLAEFLLSNRFQSSEERAKAELIAERPHLWQEHFEALGPECGPEKCIEESCENLRIKVAIRCVSHQLKLYKRELFG